MKKIKLGIIGTGIAAKNLHLPAIKELKDKFEITAVCNHTEKKAKEFSKLVGNVPVYLDYRDFLNDPNVEAVDISLPIELNYKVTKASLEAGKHVFLEKPLAANLNEAKKMLQFPVKYKPVMMVAENFRYRKSYAQAVKELEKKSIGKPFAFLWNVFYYVVPSVNEYARTNWRKNHKYVGGFVTDGGVHQVAAIRMMCGEIISLSAFTKSVNPSIGIPDIISIQFKTNKDIDGVLNLFFSVNGSYENRILIMGTDGTIEISDEKFLIKKEGKKNIEKIFKNDSGFTGEFEDFYKSIINKKEPVSSFKEAYKDLEVILTSLKAAGTGKKINLSK